jgi:hypothetical protein
MIKYIFANTNIKIIVYREQDFSAEEKQQIIADYNNSMIGGHSVISRTIKKLRIYYNWKDLNENVKDFIRQCDICQKIKTHKNTKQPMFITTTANRPFDRICLNIVGPLPSIPSKNMYILTIQDELSRYALAVALPSTDASTEPRHLWNFLCVYTESRPPY